MRPLLGQHPEELQTLLFGTLHVFVSQLDRHQSPRPAKPKRNAAALFIPDMGGVFSAAFGRLPSEGPAGPFARFVLGCLAETEGVPETLGGAWVQKHVKAHRRRHAKKSGDPWAPNWWCDWNKPAQDRTPSSHTTGPS